MINETILKYIIFFTNNNKNLQNEKKNCRQIKWKKENKNLNLIEVDICNAITKEITDIKSGKIKMRKKDYGQLIEYYQDKKLVDKFRILSIVKNKESELKLMRFDTLPEQKFLKNQQL